ncbi:hypothetical protein BJ138DRAFT_1132799 [Hygrophoropsis aurantiaca]|uniref:Uncharacterized protein n=1 Tax=Hygrophoropsis aurantiaca TaxID=72124 RepID=A0ACB8APF2_9AGAM|nr:hypothetical protein BJ138DRAFT_1132799 [Hygrophoropsis aurantiaca]
MSDTNLASSPILIYISPIFGIQVGASSTGLVAALTLLRNGVHVRIIDKDPLPRIEQRGSGLQPRSLEMFRFLGVPEVDQIAISTPRITIYKPGTLEHLKSFHVTTPMDSSPAFPYTLDRILGTELRSFEQYDDHIIAYLAKMKEGKEIKETVKIRWLVGADEAKGVVRKHLGLSFLGETRDDMRMVIGDIRLGVVVSVACASLRGTDEHAEDGYQFFLAGPELDTAKIASSKDEIVNAISSIIGPDVKITFEELICTGYTSIRMVNKFGEGRIFVAGGEYGLNSGVQDAFNLGWKLALVETGLAPQSILETYYSERLPVIAEMLDLTTTLLDRAFARHRSQKMDMLGVNYRFSPIVIDEFASEATIKQVDAYGLIQGGCLVAGDRAPDALGHSEFIDGTVGPTTRLFDIFRPYRHTVLVFTPHPANSNQILSANIILMDHDGDAYNGHMVGEETTIVVVVRPDGVVGAMVRGANGLDRYFSMIFSA